MLIEQPLRGQSVGQPEPDEERALAPRVVFRERRERSIAARLVERTTLLDAVLRSGEGCDGGLLRRHEDPRELVALQVLDPRDDLGVADRKTDPPARHAI